MTSTPAAQLTAHSSLNGLRKFSRRAWWLHGLLISQLALVPLPSYPQWSDSDADGSADIWSAPGSGITYTLADLDAISPDIDGDGATNLEELEFGANPFVYDTDGDGLNDGDEIHLANQGQGLNLSLVLWDSNGNYISDYDEFYGSFTVVYTNGELPSHPSASYSDFDGDGIKNPFDVYPNDPLNNDSDSDGITDDLDPVLSDTLNYSNYNSLYWYGAAVGDSDGDNILNYWDAEPNNTSNGSSDGDSDGIPSSEDPYPEDHSNYSYTNGIYWYNDVLSDADGDGIINYQDSWPYDSGNGVSSGVSDSDNDGYNNDVDPFPWDFGNYASCNGISWYHDAFSDSDGDGILNYQDPWPYDAMNGVNYYSSTDSDYDGLSDDVDPYPSDYSNYSSVNYINWYNIVLGDNDGDNLLNHADAWPEDPSNGGGGQDMDYDDDGIEDLLDPAPDDYNNHSQSNGLGWYGGYALEDLDNDGLTNFLDPFPWNKYDNLPDYDGDGILNNSDPMPKDSSNFSQLNNRSWAGQLATMDNDSDGIPNWYDNEPDSITDSDADGVPDHTDLFQPLELLINKEIPWMMNWQIQLSWQRPGENLDVIGTGFITGSLSPNDDADADGTINFWDSDPFPDARQWTPLDDNNDGFLDFPPPDWYGNQLYHDMDGDGLTDPFDPDPYTWPASSGTPQQYSGNEVFPGFWQDEWTIPLIENYITYGTGTYPDGTLKRIRSTVLYYGDFDLDGIRNYLDAFPKDPINGNADLDGDGLSNSGDQGVKDPLPHDPSNTSYINDTSWYDIVWADADNDGITNFFDPRPYESDVIDSDGDGFLDHNDPAPNKADNTSPYNGVTWWNNIYEDEDEDGILNFFDEEPQTIIAEQDPDQDGLSNSRESIIGTDPENADTDKDYLTDGEEYRIYGSSPLDAFSISKQRWGTDNDDFVHVYTDSQLLDLTDTDGDSIPDKVEIYHKLNPESAVDANADLDQNGLNNAMQYSLGIFLDADRESVSDRDKDGLSDVFEDYYRHYLSRNKPEDAVADPDGDGVINIEERLLGLRPDQTDSRMSGSPLGDLWVLMNWICLQHGLTIPTEDLDGNQIPDAADARLLNPMTPENFYYFRVNQDDLDGDGLPDLWEHEFGSWRYDNGLKIRVADANQDNDDDGLSNLWEFRLNSNPLVGDSNQDGLNDADEDTDQDGLSNIFEIGIGTDPLSSDSDGDGISDADENRSGTDPLDSASNVQTLLGLSFLSRVE